MIMMFFLGFAHHGLDRSGACKNEEVAPRETQPILLLDRPQQRPCLVEVGVVFPTALGVEALPPAVAAPAAVREPVPWQPQGEEAAGEAGEMFSRLQNYTEVSLIGAGNKRETKKSRNRETKPV